jgi:hypothetical protein
MNIDLQIKETNDKLLDVIRESKLPVTVLSYMIQDILNVINVNKQITLKQLSEVKKDGE